MIHWDWVLTAVVAALLAGGAGTVIAFFVWIGLDAALDAWERRRLRRAIACDCRKERLRRV